MSNPHGGQSTLPKLALFEWLIVVAAAVVSAFGIPPSATLGWPVALVLALLVVATVVFQRGEGRAGRFEAAVAFPAVFLFSASDPWIACSLVFSGLALGGVVSQHRLDASPRLVLSRAAQATLAYGFGAWLFREALAARADVGGQLIGAIILATGFLAVALTLASLRRILQGGDYRIGLVRDLLRDFKSLLLIAPIVAAEVLIYPHYGVLGFVVAFLPVAFVAFAIRGEVEAESRESELSRRTRELSTLSKGSLELFTADDHEMTASRLFRLLDSILPMRACAVVLWAPDADESGTVFRFGNCQPSDQAILKWLESAAYDHSAPRRPIVTAPTDGAFRVSDAPAWQLLGGLQTTEVIYGIVILESDSEGLRSPDTIDLLNLVLTQCGLSLQDQYLKREMLAKNVQLERQAETMASILSVSGRLLGTFDAARIAETVREAIERTEGVGSVVVARFDSKRSEYVHLARRFGNDVAIARGGSDEATAPPPLRVPASRVAELSAPHARVSNSYFYPLTELGRREAALLFGRESAAEMSDESNILIVPLSDQEALVGLLMMTLESAEREAPVDRVQTIEIFANQAVTALRSARQYEEIRRLTIIDGLTQAYNHRYFQDALQKAIRGRAGSDGAKFALAMIDIDNFKRINDSYGHQAGDEILKALVQHFVENVREGDTVARYGGEEFAIILPDRNADTAFEVADRIRRTLEEKSFEVGPRQSNLHVTVSIGVAECPADGMTSATLVARADAALYSAKRTGKNRVRLASELDQDVAASQAAT